MTTEERITELEFRFEKELAEIKAEIANQNQPKFKKGDFVFSKYGEVYSIVITDEYISENENLHYLASLTSAGGLRFDGYIGIVYEREDRPATDTEKQQLIDKLRENGKDWDYVNKQIVDYRWAPELEECYFVPDVFSVGLVDDYCNTDNLFDRRVIEKNLAFRTPEEAIAVAKEWLQTRK